MKIHHRPELDIETVVDHYSQKDGVPIKYVCTTELKPRGHTYEVFYRETPHPEFGNRYFGLTFTCHGYFIGNADIVEELEFTMGKDTLGVWHYSKYTHDFYCFDGGCVDGGRSYGRILGSETGLPEIKLMRVKDGEFYEL